MALTNVDAAALQTGYECVISSEPVTGGTLYVTALRQGGDAPVAIATSFVPTAVAGGTLRYLSATQAKADTGATLTATATGGAMGIARTAGTSLALLSEATSSSAKTDKALWQVNLPDSYQAGANIPVLVNNIILGTGTLTGASCTLSVAGYTEVAGVETALTVSAAQTITAVQGTNTFSVTGTGLVPGQPLALELTGLVTSSSGANTIEIASIAFQA